MTAHSSPSCRALVLPRTASWSTAPWMPNFWGRARGHSRSGVLGWARQQQRSVISRLASEGEPGSSSVVQPQTSILVKEASGWRRTSKPSRHLMCCTAPLPVECIATLQTVPKGAATQHGMTRMPCRAKRQEQPRSRGAFGGATTTPAGVVDARHWALQQEEWVGGRVGGGGGGGRGGGGDDDGRVKKDDAGGRWAESGRRAPCASHEHGKATAPPGCLAAALLKFRFNLLTDTHPGRLRKEHHTARDRAPPDWPQPHRTQLKVRRTTPAVVRPPNRHGEFVVVNVASRPRSRASQPLFLLLDDPGAWACVSSAVQHPASASALLRRRMF